jgi:hypothetical protein
MAIASALQVRDQLWPFDARIVEVCLVHPARQRGVVELRVRNALDRVDAHAALARGAPLAARVLRVHRSRCHDQNQKLDLVKLLLDLLPPADAALELQAVHPHSNPRRIDRELREQIARQHLSIGACVGHERAVAGGTSGNHVGRVRERRGVEHDRTMSLHATLQRSVLRT